MHTIHSKLTMNIPEELFAYSANYLVVSFLNNLPSKQNSSSGIFIVSFECILRINLELP